MLAYKDDTTLPGAETTVSVLLPDNPFAPAAFRDQRLMDATLGDRDD
ncbi:hypothetical protein BFJ68_g16778 [Fusarium oxysporum]|uniref:Uncharacterized protein n=1 Tax=Fusarium oxysporum TaxID=5507 RepID=A0A420P9H2_FUSOX|nr:hypothetical protein BFJ68_g16778 [Fusarium oxysporum]